MIVKMRVSGRETTFVLLLAFVLTTKFKILPEISMETEGFVHSERTQRTAEEDEEDAEDWTDLERFQNFITSEHALRRLVCVRGLTETVRGISCMEAVKTVIPLLLSASKDDESSVREALASQITPSLKVLLDAAKPDEADEIMDAMWPISIILIRDKDQQVRSGVLTILIDPSAFGWLISYFMIRLHLNIDS
jgi:hypothetical protein